ncbi:hypothetical protein CC2G_006742 [Coprinopsis cinerea AmutBmut pab1-1]|nr:hypothetical protein CC2G_006742 [Coprinopsis cinerea AmutBmut pab1-1]
MAVAVTDHAPKKAARGPSRNTSLTKSGARHKGRRPTGKEPRPRPERPVYRDTVERIKWFTARAEILAILTPTEARCKIYGGVAGKETVGARGCERIRVRDVLAHLCGPSPSAAILVQMNQLSLTGFQTLPNGSTTNEQHNSNQHI